MTAIYNKIGQGYNETRSADPYLLSRLEYHLKPQAERQYLDIGCGTGNYTSEFQKRGYKFIGIDPSSTMLEKARLKNKLIDWRMASAEDTKLDSESIDGVTAFLTIHHWSSVEDGFMELSRVMKKSARFVLFTSTPQQMNNYWLNHYFPKMLHDSKVVMPTKSSIESALLKAGLTILTQESYAIKDDLQDQFLFVGKQKPELYFDSQIRSGISSFSALSNQEEVEKGLARLHDDVDSKRFQAVADSFSSQLGDYLFLVAEK